MNGTQKTQVTIASTAYRIWRRAAVLVSALLVTVTAAGAQQWPAETVHRVRREVDGGYPTALIRASDGNLYGVAPDTYTGHGGSVFRMRPDGAFTVLYRFSGGLDGDTPASGLLQAADGNLYGMCVDGGRYGLGTIFRMTLDGQFTVLYSFSGQPDGAHPSGKLIQRTDGTFYGVTAGGGAWNNGAAFRMSAEGTVTTLHHFNYPQSAYYTFQPVLGLVEFGGAFYGIVDAYWSAKVYRMSADGSTVTFVFDISLFDGDYSAVGLTGLPIKASDGNLYGTSKNGCKGTKGTFYRIAPDGTVTLVREFESCRESPQTELTEVRDGSFVVPGRDRILRLTPSGELATVRQSDSSLNLYYPYGPFLETPDGNLYGITDPWIYRLQPKSLTPTVRVNRRAPIQLSWTPVFAAASYTVRRTNVAGGVEVLGRLSGTSFIDHTAVPGQRYRYSVTSTGVYGESDFVESAAAMVMVNRPMAYDADGDGRADVISYESDGQWRVRPPNGEYTAGIRWGGGADVPAPGDYDGDGAMDLTVFRPSNGTWYLRGIGTAVWGQPGDTPVPGDYDGDGTTDIAVYRRSSGVWYVRGKVPLVWGEKNDVPVPADFNGDGVTDIAVYRPSTGVWYVRGIATVSYGIVGDTPLPADYDGDGTADFAVYRRTNGTWYVRGQFAMQWGGAGDVPVALDRDGDGRTELGVFSPSQVTWKFKDPATGSAASVIWGPSTGVPIGSGIAQQQRVNARVNRDFDNDGRDDVMVYRPSTGDWFLRSSERPASYRFSMAARGGSPVTGDFDGDGLLDLAGFLPNQGTWRVWLSPSVVSWTYALAWGTAGDIPVPADYDGDGETDMAVFRPAAGVWHILDVGSYIFGGASDIPVPADYNGDGTIEIAVYRAGEWLLRGADPIRFGVDGDIPVPADYDGDGITDIAIFRPSTGTWHVRNQLTMQWGASGDVPVPLDRDGDGRAELIVYRPSNGTWYFNNPATGTVESVVWGIPGDMPVGRGTYWTYR